MKMHIFKYSKRDGTKAAIMEDQIDGNIKEKRSNILIELSDKYEKEFMKKYIGKYTKVLFEQSGKDYTEGHTKNYILVKVPKNSDLENKMENVKILKLNELSLEGEIN